MPKIPIVRKWLRVMAVGCSHGDLANPDIKQQVLEFRKRFCPDYRFDLGDLMDTACFRSGAPGTKDEAKSPRDDHAVAISWLRQYEPTHIAWGNHDWRLYELRDHPKAIVAMLADNIWTSLTNQAKKLKAKTVPYDIQHGWHFLGGRAWGHGYMYNLFAVRDHAEMLGMPVVMAHLHAPQQVEGRTVRDTSSFCVGAIADDMNLVYGRKRRNSLIHGHGIVYGEVCGDESHLWLIRSENGKLLHFPPGI
jgi:predicted MPP superfamily phosphohydrolase